MNIAIAAPTAVPFCVGGAEKLWAGLLAAIRQYTPHQAELIQVPTPEGTARDLIASYRRFAELDLSRFDCLITGKYPAWMIRHPRHICYMLHRLRGLYDTYRLTGQPLDPPEAHPAVRRIRAALAPLRENAGGLSACFDELERVLEARDLPAEIAAFPGPTMREIVRFLDGIALAPERIVKYAAISRNVANRKDYFPDGCDVEVIHPPSSLPAFRCGRDDYLFTVSRLDNAKRVELMIQAMRFVKAGVELRIAGTGPNAEALRKLARDDARIRFLGFVSDEALIDLYADALAVLYTPYDEDYGLVTIEAMMSAKPLMTTTDSGGPTEFVVNGENGLIAPPDPKALGERIDDLCAHREEAKQMGLRGRTRAESLTWKRTVERLLDVTPRAAATRKEKRKKLTVAVAFPVYPPRNGGQVRVYQLYRQLARHYDVDLVTFTNADAVAFQGEIAPGLREYRIRKSVEHQQAEWRVEQQAGHVVADVVMPELYPLTPEYMRRLRASVAESEGVVACHPYLLPALQDAGQRPLWYEAQDVETDLKRALFSGTAAGKKLLRSVERIEKACCELSERIIVCSKDDAARLAELWNAPPAKIVYVPNGVDTEAIRYVTLDRRREVKRRLGMDDAFIALFVGSWHPPNIEAVRTLVRLAAEAPRISFLIAGSVGMAFRGDTLPANCRLLGEVDDATKEVLLDTADAALNPIVSGSGTNLKLLEYFASGIPVVSTPFGARGFDVVPDEHGWIVEREAFADALSRLREEPPDRAQARCERARRHVEQHYDWRVIAEGFLAAVGATV